jgi:hypothetical protein
MAHDPWNESEIVRSTIFGNDGTGTYRPVQVDANGALKIQGGTTNPADVLNTDPTNASAGMVVRNIPWGTYETLLLNDTVVLQAEVQENTAPPGMTTVLVTGGLDRARLAKTHAVDSAGRLMVSVKGTTAPRWMAANRKTGITTAGAYIMALKHKGNINGTTTTHLAYLDQIAALVSVGSYVYVLLNPTLTGTTWTDIETANSFMQVDTAGALGSGGRLIYGFGCGAAKETTDYGAIIADLANLAITLNPNDILAFMAAPEASTGSIRLMPNWHEAP